MNFEVDAIRDEMLESLQRLIQIRSVEGPSLPGMPFGKGVSDALSYTLELGRKMGFRAVDLDGYAGYIEYGEGEEEVGILAHLDVVPEGSDWDHPPFGAEIRDGRLFGRGTVDDKGPAISCLYAMKLIKDSGVSLSRRIRLILGVNEETGWKCMEHYFAVEKPPTLGFTPDADFPVIHGEKGILVFDLESACPDSKQYRIHEFSGGNAPNMVPDFCRLSIEGEVDRWEDHLATYPMKERLHIESSGKKLTIEARGVSAHGSTPEKGLNAISILFDFLKNVVDPTSRFGELVTFYNEKIGFYLNGEKIGCGLQDEVSGKLNFNLAMVQRKEDQIVFTINIRYPILATAEEVYSGIENVLQGSSVRLVRGASDSPPLYVPKEDFLVDRLMKVYQEETGDRSSEPITIGGGTYARASKNLVAFGPVFPGSPDVIHQKNEYIDLEDLMKMTRIYTKAIFELAK